MRFMVCVFLIAILGFTSSLIGQDQSSSPDGSNRAAQNQGQPQNQNNTENDKDKTKDKNDKQDKKKKKKDNSSADDISVPTTFSDAVAHDVLQQLTDGLEGHSERLMLSAFDDNKMDGYLNFEDQILAFFQHYDSFRVHFRIAQATTEGSKGVVLVDIEMEEMPRAGNAQPVRKRDQMRFEMERGKKGWKIVDLRPRTFFS